MRLTRSLGQRFQQVTPGLKSKVEELKPMYAYYKGAFRKFSPGALVL